MNHALKKRLKKAGLPPGTLVSTGEEPGEKIKISLFEYDENQLIEGADVSPETCLKKLETPLMTWIQVKGVSDPAVISTLGSRFHLHSLILEDVLNTAQRAKLDSFDNQVFIVLRLLHFDDATETLGDEQVSLIFGPHYLISFLERDEDVFKPIEERLRQGNTRLRKQGSDYLAYSILDLIVDHYYVILDKVDTSLEALEEELIRAPKADTIKSIQKAKREMILLRKSIWPMRDVISRFQRLESPELSPVMQVYLRDVYDHIVQMMDIIEGFRDVVSGMMDVYLSNINVRTNDIMKVLTIVSTIFVPLTFISSLYGMNFQYMPELYWRWGYPLILIVMVLIAIGMLIFFRRKRWF